MRGYTLALTRKQQLKQQLEDRKLEFELLIAEYIRGTTLKYSAIAEKFGIGVQDITRIAIKHNCTRPRGKASPAYKGAAAV